MCREERHGGGNPSPEKRLACLNVKCGKGSDEKCSPAVEVTPIHGRPLITELRCLHITLSNPGRHQSLLWPWEWQEERETTWLISVQDESEWEGDRSGYWRSEHQLGSHHHKSEYEMIKVWNVTAGRENGKGKKEVRDPLSKEVLGPILGAHSEGQFYFRVLGAFDRKVSSFLANSAIYVSKYMSYYFEMRKYNRRKNTF